MTTSAKIPYGRTSPYRRIQKLVRFNDLNVPRSSATTSPLATAHTNLSNFLARYRTFSSTSRSLAISFRDLKGESKTESATGQEQKSGVGDQNKSTSQKAVDPAEDAYQQARKESEKEWAKFRDQAQEQKEQESERAKSEDQGADENNNKERAKREPPSPPPDNRTPWQVFTETLKSEFKASKEWNESTKAITSSAHQFTENESVKRARAAYTAASGAASSGTASALKGAGKSLGQGAAWTWDTTVIKGVRHGVNATGRAIDSATKPVRDTKAFKSVKDVIDDGSSSRYGGWVEKEERRKQREVRELQEAAASGRSGRRVEKMEEDPEYARW